jgi:hypothetical protein
MFPQIALDVRPIRARLSSPILKAAFYNAMFGAVTLRNADHYSPTRSGPVQSGAARLDANALFWFVSRALLPQISRLTLRHLLSGGPRPRQLSLVNELSRCCLPHLRQSGQGKRSKGDEEITNGDVEESAHGDQV